MHLNPKVMVLASLSTLIPVFLYLCNVFSYEDLGPACLGIFMLVCIIQWYSYDSPDMALFIDDTGDNILFQENKELAKELKQARALVDSYKLQVSDLLANQQSEPLGEVLKRRVASKPPPPPAPRTCVGKHRYKNGECVECGHTAHKDFFIASRNKQIRTCLDHGHVPDKYGVRCKRCGCAVA